MSWRRASLTLALTVLCSLCSNSALAATSSEPILIGEVGSLTLVEAVFGISNRNGIELALDEQNTKGGIKGRKLQVRVYDSASKPEDAQTAAKRLVTADKVVAILGEIASGNSLAMAPIAQAAKVPQIAPSSVNFRVTQVGNYIFRACFVDRFQGPAMAKFVREGLKFTRVAILADQKSAYSEGLSLNC